MNDYQRTLWKKKQDYLMHHGIEGQKWGKRNGPPYPLDSSISTGKKLKKQSNKQSKATKDSSTAAAIAALSAIYGIPLGLIIGQNIYSNHQKKKYENAYDEYKKNFKEYEKHFGETAKAIGKGDPDAIAKCKKEGDPTIVTKTDLLGINAYGIENPNGKKNKVDNSLRPDGSSRSLTTTTYYYQLKRDSFGRSRNCPNCSTAFVLNKLGWRLNAAPVFEHGRTSKEIYSQNKEMFKGYKREKVMTTSDFKSSLSKKKDGSFGSFDFFYRSSGGHILNWAKENGKVYIYDAQNGKKMSVNKFVNQYNPSFGDVGNIHDMTGCTINWDAVAKYKYTY